MDRQASQRLAPGCPGGYAGSALRRHLDRTIQGSCAVCRAVARSLISRSSSPSAARPWCLSSARRRDVGRVVYEVVEPAAANRGPNGPQQRHHRARRRVAAELPPAASCWRSRRVAGVDGELLALAVAGVDVVEVAYSLHAAL